MRLRLVPAETNWDFFKTSTLTLGLSALMMVASVVLFFTMGLNYGIDFKGGTTIRTDAKVEVDVGGYRDAIAPLGLGDVSITEVFDPAKPNLNVTQIRIEAQEGDESVAVKTVADIETVLGEKFGGKMFLAIKAEGISDTDVAKFLTDKGYAADVSKTDTGVLLTFKKGLPTDEAASLKNALADTFKIESIPGYSYELIKFPSVESVGPKVSGELVWTAVEAVIAAIVAVLFYIWLRFEWQFSLGAVVALVHDVTLTIGIFALVQIKFDLAIIAALLTIVGYSLNDTVVVFDRVRENLRKFKKLTLKDVLNLSINETLSRTVMTSVTTLIALIALFVLGGDVIRGFVFAMIWGVIVGTYSSVFIASAILLRLGVKRDWSKKDPKDVGGQYAKIDA